MPRRLTAILLALSAAACGKSPPPPDAKPDPPRASASTVSSAAPPPAPTARASASAPAAAVVPARHATCPHVLTGKPEAWRAKLVNADDKTQDALLAEVGIVPLTLGTSNEGQPAEHWGVDRVTVSKAALAGAKPDDYWVEVRYVGSGGQEEARGVATAALIKQADGTYCGLRGPSEAQWFSEHACIGGPDVWPIVFYMYHIVDKDRMTVLAEASSGRCASGCSRGGHDDVTLYDVQGFDLVNVYHQDVFEAFYSGCPNPPESIEAGSVEWVGPGLGGPTGSPTPAAGAATAYPRDLLSIKATVCPDSAPPGNCTPSGSETRYAFTGGTYKPVGAPRTRTAPLPLLPAVTDGGVDDGSGRGWAGRCFKRLGESKLEEAESACQHALERATDVNIQASTYYNLALIAEKLGDNKSACAHVKASLAIRPNNATTLAKKDEVCK